MKRIFVGVLLIMGMGQLSLAGDITQYRLKNGLTLLVKVDKRAPVVVNQIWYKVGASDEVAGQTGLSHMLEHLLFKGTKAYPDGKFSKLIADNGGRDNAFTSYDYTAYYELIGADKLRLCMKLEADRMQNLVVREDEFEKEKQVVMEERRMRTDDNPVSKTYERFLATAHISSPYHHSVIGWMADLKQMRLDQAMAWYHRWYVPNNAIIVVVGDVEPKQVYHWVKHYFGHIPAKLITVAHTQPEQQPLGERHVMVRQPATTPTLFMGYNVPSIKTTHETQAWQPYALTVLSAVLGGLDSSRLEATLVNQTQKAAAVGSYYDLYRRYDTLFVISATPSAKTSLSILEQSIKQQIDRLKQTPISTKELERAKAKIIAADIYQKDSLSQQATKIGQLASIGLPWQQQQRFIAQIKQVSAKQVQQVARQYLRRNHLTVAELIPTKKPVNKPKTQGAASVH